MAEGQVYIKNNELMIEALLNKSVGDKGVVICHPHSLMGGSMYNNVVEAIQETFAQENYTTLRFNFRGVGGSTGVYDEGRGEQEDILTVGKYLQSIGVSKLSLAGYSFGAWIGSSVMEKADNHFNACVFVSPPINYFDFDFAKLSNKIDLIICGNKDQFCNLEVLKEQTKYINSTIKIIPDADHFYRGKEEELVKVLKNYLINGKK